MTPCKFLKKFDDYSNDPLEWTDGVIFGFSDAYVFEIGGHIACAIVHDKKSGRFTIVPFWMVCTNPENLPSREEISRMFFNPRSPNNQWLGGN
jgi:hypothetical protein